MFSRFIYKMATKKFPVSYWIDLFIFMVLVLGVLFWREAYADKTVRNTGTISVSIRQFSDNAQLDIDPDEQVTTDNATADYLLQYKSKNRDNDLEYVEFEQI